MQALANEEELIKQAQNGDKQAMGKLYEAYAPPIFQYISYRVESDAIAEDLMAEVFLRLVRGIKNYHYTGAPLGAWLFRIAANQITDYYRKRGKYVEADLSETLSSNQASPLEILIQEEERERLRIALQSLPEDYQNVLILRFMQDMSHASVAEVMERSESAVRVLQHRALKALNAVLSRQESDSQQPKGENDDE